MAQEVLEAVIACQVEDEADAHLRAYRSSPGTSGRLVNNAADGVEASDVKVLTGGPAA